jgi:SDR family mycofactocin-dependent oxidoreductase
VHNLKLTGGNVVDRGDADRYRAKRSHRRTGEQMGLLDAKVAFVTGAARGQGRCHAVRLAREGAAVIAVDVAAPVANFLGYAPATASDLDETRDMLAEVGRPHHVARADVRDSAAMERILAEAIPKLGQRLDIVVANAGIAAWGRLWEISDEAWGTVIDVNLTGVWRTLRAAVPHMLAAGNGGSIITISSVAGIKSLPGQSHYAASKHGVTGLTKSAALELGEYGIRVNSIHPWGVGTAMVADANLSAVLEAHPNYQPSFSAALPDLPVADCNDIADAVVWLASDMSRAVTASQITVDMGATKI